MQKSKEESKIAKYIIQSNRIWQYDSLMTNNSKYYDSLAQSNNNIRISCIVDEDQFLLRIEYASLICFFTAFIIGMISVMHNYILKLSYT